MVKPINKIINKGFDEAVLHVEQIIKEEGFSHILTKHVDEIIKTKLAVKEYQRYCIILACAPQMAKAALDVSKDVGLLFPCSFTVYEDLGKIWVGHISIMKIAPVLDLAPKNAMKPVIEMTGKAVQACWSRF